MRVEEPEEPTDLRALIFPHGLIDQVISLLVDVWKTIRPPTDEGEPTITRRFVGAMQVERRRRNYRFSVKPHEEELEHLDEATGHGFGVIDIVMPHGYDERCYFGIEAKKLNGVTESGNPAPGHGEYVGADGMGCLIQGRYACYQPHAGMVGYVMDGDCAAAKSKVVASMQRKREDLRMDDPVRTRTSQHRPDDPDVFETQHHLDRGDFTVYHVLLAA